MGSSNKSNNLAMKQLVMIRVLGQDTYKKVVEIDITKFKYKYRLRNEAIGTLDNMNVAICIDDYEQIKEKL